ncbi:hypothetical protein OKA04_24395, partial [Luteolibacter flavescens]|nr:hypothetical protein [Luteolibacter flavescens]
VHTLGRKIKKNNSLINSPIWFTHTTQPKSGHEHNKIHFATAPPTSNRSIRAHARARSMQQLAIKHEARMQAKPNSVCQIHGERERG